MSDTVLIPVVLNNSDSLKHDNKGGVPITKEVVDTISTLKVEKQIASSKIKSNIKDTVKDTNDDGSVLIVILQCETKMCDINISNLKWAFSDPYFTIQVCSVDPPANYNVSKTFIQAQQVENYNMRKALLFAAEGPYIKNSADEVEPQYFWTKKPVIIIKDSSITNLNSLGFHGKNIHDDIDTTIEDSIISGLKYRIKTSLERANQADLFFLCKWNDACDKFVDVEGGSNLQKGSTLKWSTQPTATQAIMYNPSSRDYIIESLNDAATTLSDFLNSQIAKGNLLATVFVPNIIDYDISLATTNEDYAKLNECAPVLQTTQGNTNLATLIWFIFIMIIMVLVAWALIQLSPQYAGLAS